MGQAGGEDHKGIEYSDKNGLRKRHLRRWIRSDDKLIAIYLERERREWTRCKVITLLVYIEFKLCSYFIGQRERERERQQELEVGLR